MSKKPAKVRLRKKIALSALKRSRSPRTATAVRRRGAVRGPGAAFERDLERTMPRLAELRSAFGLSREKFSRLTGFSVRSLAAWESGASPGELARVRFTELHRLQSKLSRLIRPTAIREWLDAPNAALDGLKPIEVVERGQIDRLWRMIFELESGVAS